jgi:hypothetical protein
MRRHGLLLLLFGLAPLVPPAHAGVKVDIGPDSPRGDLVTPEWQNWKVPEGPSASATFGDVTVTLRKAGSVGTGLAAGYWKGGLAQGATMASDGVFVKDGDHGGQVEMVLHGLPAGKHGIVTYHNSLWDAPVSGCDISADGSPVVKGFRPSRRVTDDQDAAAAFFEVNAAAGRDVVIGFHPDGTGQVDNVILNGFELDAVDPALRARKPSPAHRDGHSPEDPVLTWVPSRTAIAHHVYLGTDARAVAGATVASPEYRGEQAAARFESKGLSNLATYYWRVDEVQPGPAPGPTRGEVWMFRVRHLAFPGAEGYGRFAAGGRGGRVIEVTNLNDDGPGSLRAACEAEGPRTAVFRVGGTIELKSKIIVHNPSLTVAGQTAPGDGVCLKGYSFGCLGTHDVVIRYLRLRVGDESGKTLDGMGARGCDHVIYDHCSISWSIDEGFSSREAKNITFQRCLIAEALNLSVHSHYVGTGKGHSFAGSISGDVGSFHHNLLAHCAGRNWSLAGGLDWAGRLAGRLDLRNNVVYNWEHRTTDGGCRELNFVNNFYIPGPASRVFTLQKPDPGDPGRGMRIFMTGNVIEGHPTVNADNWTAAVLDAQDLPRVRSDAPLFESHVTTQSAREVYESVLADVGANLPKQDAVDARLVEDVRKRGSRFVGSKSKLPGIIDSQTDVGGWPEYRSAEPPADGDHDGIPDEWERQHGLDPNDPADAARDSGDGYTNLEKYLNGIKPQ